MTYQEALKSISNRLIFGSKPGLKRIQMALNALGNPQKKLKFVHVAGTNGKGTTCTYIASVLKEAGYRVGLYTSPYVVDFRERFKLNGEMISETELAQQVEILDALKMEFTKDLTEFEYITALAFNWFLEKNCDVVVLEVGLGGRFDATNVIENPLACVITSISLDHTEFLGETNQEIAFEKGGIIKEGSTCVLYPSQPQGVQEVIKDICEKNHGELVLANSKIEIIKEDLFGTKAKLNGVELVIPFSGGHQVLNAATALTTIGVLKDKGFNINDLAIKEGFAKSEIAARMEVLSSEPLVILDGGHNTGCATALKGIIETHLKGKTLCAIMGMMKDKDSRSYLKEVAPFFTKIITVTPNNPRSLSRAELCQAAKEHCSDCQEADTMEKAVIAAYKAGCQGVIICGSLYLAGEIRGVAIKHLTGDINR